MKRWMMLGLLIPTLALARWEDRTDQLQGPRAEVGKKRYLQFSPGMVVPVTLEKKRSVRWILIGERSGTFELRQEGTVLRTWKLRPGTLRAQVTLEAGTYTFAASVPVMARFAVWKVRRWVSLPPVGGGDPLMLVVGDRTYTYYRIKRGESVRLKIKGPTRAHLFFRGILRSRWQEMGVHLVLKEGETILMRKVKRLRASQKARIQDRQNRFPTRPLVLEWDVPKGTHIYTVELREGDGMLKLYRNRKRRKRTGARRRRSLRGMVMPGGTGLWMQGVLQQVPKAKKAQKIRRRKRRRRARRPRSFARLEWGAILGYESNVYHWPDTLRSQFAQNPAHPRFQDVGALGDLPVTLKASLVTGRRSRYALYGGGYATLYPRNAQLNRWGVRLGVRGYRPFRYAVEYLEIPHRGIRPTQDSLGTYSLLTFHYRRVTATLSPRRRRTRPEMTLQVGQYDFLDPFSMYDAWFGRILLGLRRPGRWGVFFLAGQVNSSPDPALHRDWSHRRLGVVLEASWRPVRRQRLTFRAALDQATYTTRDTLDNHYGRVDRNVSVTLRYEPGRLGRLRPFLAYTYQRRAVSGAPVADVFKDYTDHRLQLGVNARLRLR